MNERDPFAQVERVALRRLPEDDPALPARVAAAAAYIRWRVAADGHISRHEREMAARSLTRDFDEAAAALAVELVRSESVRLGASSFANVTRFLGRWLFPSLRASRDIDYANLVQQELALRWPLPSGASARAWQANEISWSDAGIQIGTGLQIHGLTIPWSDVYSLELVDPWPEVIVEWAGFRAEVSQVRLRVQGERAAFGHRVEALFAAAREKLAVEALDEGWLAEVDVDWEPRDHWPDEAPPSVGYRAPAREKREILASRPRRGGLGVMLEWLASRPERPFLARLVEACATADHVYVRRARRIERLALAHLRGRLGGDDGLYLFGRRASLLLTDARSCELAAYLDRRLTE